MKLQCVCYVYTHEYMCEYMHTYFAIKRFLAGINLIHV